ncbi:DUF3150 domain-containing protein [Acinetobacter sp.]|uniref:DUF3150 domain-containing protein n=1 Tax=Acinetobacter sp. TaxID=472 RepID=UPI003CFE91C8
MTQATQTTAVLANTANTPFLDQVSVVWLNVNIWSGQTKLKEEDLQLGYGSKLPPTSFANLGSKKLLNPKRLNEFNTIKSQAKGLLEKHGLKFMDSYAIPLDKAKDISFQLDDIAKSFNAAKSVFLSEFNELVDEWCREYPDHEASIRNSGIKLSDIDKKLNFSYQVFQIQPAHINADSLESHAAGLSDTMIDEILKVANDFYYKSCHGKDWISSRTKPTLVSLRDKIDGLSFLNGNFINLVSLLNKCISLYDKKVNGQIHAPYYHQIVNSILILSDKDKIDAYGEGRISIDQAQEPQGSLVPNGDADMPASQEPVLTKADDIKPEIINSSLDDDINNFFNSSKQESPVTQPAIQLEEVVQEFIEEQEVLVPHYPAQQAQAVIHRDYDDDNAMF